MRKLVVPFGLLLAVVLVPARASAENYAAIWEKTSGPAFVARHGMTSQAYQQAFDQLGQRGYCLALVNGYSVGNQDRYAAIWEKKNCPQFVARHGMSSQDYQQAFDQLVGQQGYRLRLVSGYEVGGQDRYAAIWEKTAGPAFVARYGMTSQAYQQAFDQLGQQGYCLTWVSGYSLGNQDRYAAIWEKTSCPPFVARHGMSSGAYQQEFNQLTGQGYRLKLVSGYELGGQPTYAAIWEKTAGPPFVARHGMTPSQYQQEFDSLVNQGYRLSLVSGY
jgi:hypothetical protein